MTASQKNLRSLYGVDIKMHAFSKTFHISGSCGPFKPLWMMSIELGTPTRNGSTDINETKDDSPILSPKTNN